MKDASAYIQIVPERGAHNSVRKLKIVKLTQGPPLDPEPGAMVLKLNLSIDEALFVYPTISAEVTGEASEVVQSIVPYPISTDDNLDDPNDQE